MTTIRRLAAILAADVAGYSRLMAADEIGTLEALKACRREIVDPTITEHRGRIVKTTGDGMLVEFASAVDAVTCAASVQKAMANRGGELTFRIGINVGDIIIDGDDIFGDGVNVAARVENECTPGGVTLSAQAFDQVRNKTSFVIDDLGEKQLKNIDRPIRIYAVRTSGAVAASAATTIPEAGKPLPLPDKPSIAVLPFQNMSGDPEQEYFADGMVEDIITALSRFKSLFVIARNSSFTYKGKAVDIKQVGRELGVRYVLEGSVRKAGGRVRIAGQLIEAATNNHLWADRFDGALEDVFELQDSVTERVVTAIFPRLEAAETSRAQQKRPENLDAYDSVLRAQAALRQQDPAASETALDHLKRAIELAPNYALAHALSAACYTRHYIAGTHSDLEQVRAKALHFARRAIELDSDDAEVLTHSALTLGNFDDVERATRLGERAVSLNPNSSFSWYALGAGVMYLGDQTRAIECEILSLRLSPSGPNRAQAMSILSMAHFLSGEAAKSHEWAERAFQENPNSIVAVRALVLSSIAVGDNMRARMAFARFATDLPKQLARMKEMMRRSQDFEMFSNAVHQAAALR